MLCTDCCVAKLDLSHLSEINAPKATTEVMAAENKNESSAKDKNTDPSLTLNRLVLEKGHHQMIVSLIAQHFRDKKSITGQREEFDLVKGKGKVVNSFNHYFRALTSFRA